MRIDSVGRRRGIERVTAQAVSQRSITWLTSRNVGRRAGRGGAQHDPHRAFSDMAASRSRSDSPSMRREKPTPEPSG